jgi:hypothetical protein
VLLLVLLGLHLLRETIYRELHVRIHMSMLLKLLMWLLIYTLIQPALVVHWVSSRMLFNKWIGVHPWWVCSGRSGLWESKHKIGAVLWVDSSESIWNSSRGNHLLRIAMDSSNKSILKFITTAIDALIFVTLVTFGD